MYNSIVLISPIFFPEDVHAFFTLAIISFSSTCFPKYSTNALTLISFFAVVFLAVVFFAVVFFAVVFFVVVFFAAVFVSAFSYVFVTGAVTFAVTSFVVAVVTFFVAISFPPKSL